MSYTFDLMHYCVDADSYVALYSYYENDLHFLNELAFQTAKEFASMQYHFNMYGSCAIFCMDADDCRNISFESSFYEADYDTFSGEFCSFDDYETNLSFTSNDSVSFDDWPCMLSFEYAGDSHSVFTEKDNELEDVRNGLHEYRYRMSRPSLAAIKAMKLVDPRKELHDYRDNLCKPTKAAIDAMSRYVEPFSDA